MPKQAGDTGQIAWVNSVDATLAAQVATNAGKVSDAELVDALAAERTVQNATIADAVAPKANTADVYTKTAADDRFSPIAAAPTAAVTTGVFDYARHVYNLRAANLRRTRAAVAKVYAATGFWRVAAVGDSTVAGFGAATDTSWPVVLRSLFATSAIPSAGSGMVGMNSGSMTDPRWTYDAAWVVQSSAGSARINNTTTSAAVFSSVVTGTIVRVYHASEGPFNVAIDGGAPVSVTASPTEIAIYEVTGLANTAHTVTITRVASKTVVQGVEVRSSATTGVVVYNGGITGQQVSTLGLTEFHRSVPFAAATNRFNADTIFIMCETNDANAGITPAATYKTRMQTAITNAKQAGADVILVTAVPSSGIDFTAYTQALYELADTNGLPLIDLQHRFGTYASMNALGLMSDGLHPNAAGYAAVAQTVFDALGV